MPNYLLEIDYITPARVLIAQGDTARALPFLERLPQAAETAERMRSVIEILALQAVAHRMCGNPAAARATLERALILAEPEGFVHMFIDLGELFEKLLRQWVETRHQEAADVPYRTLCLPLDCRVFTGARHNSSDRNRTPARTKRG